MKTKICSILLAVATLMALAGCASTPADRIKANQQLFNSIDPANQAIIRQGKIALGFTPNMVLLALGQPSSIARHADANGDTETWYYTDVSYYTTGVVYGGWGWGGGWRGRGWGGWGGWGWPYGGGWYSTPVETVYLQITFHNGQVAVVNQMR